MLIIFFGLVTLATGGVFGCLYGYRAYQDFRSADFGWDVIKQCAPDIGYAFLGLSAVVTASYSMAAGLGG